MKNNSMAKDTLINVKTQATDIAKVFAIYLKHFGHNHFEKLFGSF